MKICFRLIQRPFVVEVKQAEQYTTFVNVMSSIQGSSVKWQHESRNSNTKIKALDITIWKLEKLNNWDKFFGEKARSGLRCRDTG